MIATARNNEKTITKPALIIMAAGMGSRYGGLKQIDPVTAEGEILLDFSLYDAMMAGFEDVVFIISREHEEAFRNLLDVRAGKHMNIHYAFQELGDIPDGYTIPEGREKPWGTCHAVMAARKIVKGPFAVINADDYYGPSAFLQIHEFLEKTNSTDRTETFSMVGYRLKNTLSDSGHVARGVCTTDENNFLTDIVERTKIQRLPDRQVAYFDEDSYVKATDSSKEENNFWIVLDDNVPVSMNFWGFTQAFMKEMIDGFPAFLDVALTKNPLKGEYFLPSVVEKMIKAGEARVKVLPSKDKWYGMTYQEDKESVSSTLQSMKDKGLYPQKLWK